MVNLQKDHFKVSEYVLVFHDKTNFNYLERAETMAAFYCSMLY